MTISQLEIQLKNTVRNSGIYSSKLFTSAVVTLISVGHYLISFGCQLVIAMLFGASTQLDTYLVSISIPFLFMTITGGLFSFTLVPILVQKRFNREEYVQFTGLLFMLVVVFAIILPAIAYLLSPLMVQILVPTYSETLKADVLTMMRFSWLTYGSTIIISYLTAMHNSAKKFFVPVLINNIPILSMIFLVMLIGSNYGPIALVFGMFAGNLITIPLLFLGVRHEFVFNSTIFSQRKEISIVFRRMPLVILSMLGLSIYGTIDAFWATHLGSNNLSYLGYSQRILLALGNIIVLGPMTVILPYLSDAAARERFEEVRSYTLRALRMLVVFLSMAGMICSILAIPVVKLLFERGAFDRAATLEVGAIIPGMFLGVFAMVNTILIYRAYYSKGDLFGTAIISVIGAFLYFLLSGLLSNTFGLHGIVAAYAATWWILMLWAIVRFWKIHLKELWNLDNLKFICQLAVALSFCGTLVWFGKVFMILPSMEASSIQLGLRVLLTAALGSAVFIVITAIIFKMREVTILIKLLLSFNIQSLEHTR